MPRLLKAEQSNSSLVYGDEYILKVFRRIQPGVNPDLEVPGALARQGCHRVPRPVTWLRTTHPFKATLGVLQPYLRNAADGWTLALDALAWGTTSPRRRTPWAVPRRTCTWRCPPRSPSARPARTGRRRRQ
ncbi:Glucosamine kinase [Streptomyces griseoloalbus]